MWGDLIFSTLLTVMSVFMYVQASALPEGLFGTLGPGYFPKIVLGCLVLASGTLTARLLVRAVRAKRPAQAEQAASGGALPFAARYRFVGLIFALFFLYLMGMKLAGFLLSTLTFMLAAMWLLAPAPRNRGTVWVIVCTSVLLTLGLYSLFTHAFSVMLPAGLLF